MRSRLRHPVAIGGLFVLATLAFIVVLSAFVDLPGERTVKGWFGRGYAAGGCGEIRDRGSGGRWRAEAPLGTARDEVRAVRIGDAAYLAGGAFQVGSPPKYHSVRTFERYDLRSDRRTELPPLPVPRNHTGITTYRGDVYVVGGAGDDLERGSNRFLRYSARQRRWSELPPMPTARTAMGVAVVGDRLYVVGGKNNRVALAAFEAYDFRARRWVKLPPIPTRRDHVSALGYRGAVYVAGGRNEKKGVLREFDRFDPRTGRWVRLPDLSAESSGAGLLDIGGRLVVPGGENPPKRYLTGRVMAYDFHTSRWSDLPAMEHPRHGYGSVADRGRLYVFGGSRCPGQAVGVNTVDSLDVSGR